MNKLTPWQVIDNAIAEYKRITYVTERAYSLKNESKTFKCNRSRISKGANK